MQYAYGGIFIISLLLIPLYFVLTRNKQKDPWLFTLFVCVVLVNLGYMLIALSKTVEFALWANKIAYLGQVTIPLCMFMIISKLCGFTPKKWLIGVLIVLACLMFALVMTSGYRDCYYTKVSIQSIAGATILVKEYGKLHIINLLYVVLYFVALITVLCISFKKNKSASQKHAIIMLTIVFGNIAMWLIQKVIPWNFELLSVTYLMSAGAFLGVKLMLQDYVHKSDIPQEPEEEKLGVDIKTMPMETKIGKVLLHVKEGEIIGPREREILELILDNKKRKEIAEELHLSENTIKTHTRTLYMKLGVTNREELYSLLLQ